MKKIFIISAIILAIIIIIGSIVLLLVKKQQQSAGVQNAGITILSPEANGQVFSPLKIAGTVNGNGWIGFEGQVGTVKLFNSDNNEIASGILTATTDWTKPPVSFETTLEFSSDSFQEGKLIFYNENPSGLSENSKEFILPVFLGKDLSEKIIVMVYFNNNKMDPEYSCNKVFPTQRQIVRTEAIARAVLEELFKGTTAEEELQGFFTSINQGVKIQQLSIKNGTVYVDFDRQLEYQVGGSCRVSAIRAQITETLKQFPTIKNVVISIDNRTEDILQP